MLGRTILVVVIDRERENIGIGIGTGLGNRAGVGFILIDRIIYIFFGELIV